MGGKTIEKSDYIEAWMIKREKIVRKWGRQKTKIKPNYGNLSSFRIYHL